MLDFVWFMTFSILEGMAIIYFGLKLFRFKNGFFNSNNVISSALISILGFVFTELNLGSFVPLIQLFLLILVFKFIYHISIFPYSLKMGITSYVIYSLINSVASILLYYLHVIPSLNPNQFSLGAYTLQLFSTLLTIVLTIRLKNNMWGFTYVPVLDDSEEVYNLPNIILATTSFITSVSFSICVYIVFENKHIFNILSSLLLLFISTSILIYISMKRDQY